MIPRPAAAVGCLVLVFAATAAAATSHDLVIRPGVGIGKVRLGMSRAQVRSAWGAPQAVVRTGRSVELQYDFAAYVVILRGSRGRERW